MDRIALRIGIALLLCVLPLAAFAGDWKVLEDHEWCDEGWGGDWCEVREITLDDRDLIRVDSGGNGGIRVTGWDKDEIRLLVKVRVHDADDEEAEELASEVTVSTGRTIEPDGPRSRWRGRRWSVSFRLQVPRNSDLHLQASNGGISVEDVNGDIDVDTSNGGLAFTNVSGDVTGRTTNGGISVELDAPGWNGEGLDLKTTNGGVEIELPADFSAEFEARTVNGRVRCNLRGLSESRRGRRVHGTLGEGGALIRVETTNGGIRIRKS